MQITETLALADLTAVFSAAVAATVAVTSYRSTRHSARQTFDNFTLRFIETENADNRLHQARLWVEHASEDPQQALALYADIGRFFEYHGQAEAVHISRDASGNVLHYHTDGSEAASVLLQKYLYGKEQLATIVEARNTAAEALLHGLLEEQAYRLMRRRAFTNDYHRLHDFLLARQKTDPTYGQAFCQLITRWNESAA